MDAHSFDPLCYYTFVTDNISEALLLKTSNLTKLAIIFLDVLRINASDIIIFTTFLLTVGL